MLDPLKFGWRLDGLKMKTHKTAVVILPPEDLWLPIQTIRQIHDRHFRRWMPHITMIYPFRPYEKFNQLAEQFSSICKNILPFKIDLAGFKYFRHRKENYTLWVAPEPKEPIVDLQKALLNPVPDCDDVTKFKNGFTPHLSVGQIKGNPEMLKLKDALQTSWISLSFELNEICFICRNEPPDDVFRVSNKIKFKNFC